ncbi:MAG: NUDIX domain-containing protein [Alistipes sp.]
MNHTVYFADKSVTFVEQVPTEPCLLLQLKSGELISRAKVLNFFENHNFIAVLTKDADATFTAFSAEFIPIQAAGGLVKNPEKRTLMIFRNGRWDLPKGHLEAGETIEACALREVCEETGLKELWVVKKICETMHAYFLFGRWEMKQTHWYEMSTTQTEGLTPQREEGIERVKWMAEPELDHALKSTFPTIRRVVATL